MQPLMLYAMLGSALFVMALYRLTVESNLMRKILAINVMGSGVFLVLIALAKRTPGITPDVVPHAMVITGIVVAVSATALALALMLQLTKATGQPELPRDEHDSR